MPISFCALYILKCFKLAWNWSLQMLLKEWKWDTCCIDSLYLWERSHEISQPYPSYCLHNFFWVSDFKHWLKDMAHGCVKIKSLMSLNKIPNVTDFIKLFKWLKYLLKKFNETQHLLSVLEWLRPPMAQYYNRLRLRRLKDVNLSGQTNLFDQTMNDIKHHFIMNI